MTIYKRIDLEERITIAAELMQNTSLSSIGRILGRSTSSISREIKEHRTETNTYAMYLPANRCVHRKHCDKHDICAGQSYLCRKKKCSACRRVHCNETCKDYQEEKCDKLNRPPYVCNGCHTKSACVLMKFIYKADDANSTCTAVRTESRSGLNMTEEELAEFNVQISPRLRLGQSIHHIFTSTPDEFMISEKQAYRLVHSGFIDARPIDLPRMMRMKPRKAKSIELKVDKCCRKNRTYDDYKAYMKSHPDEAVLQGDSVEGVKGGKCILTLTWPQWEFQLGILRDHNNSASVTVIVDHFHKVIGDEQFRKIFPSVWQLDNGSEFSNPAAIEKYGIHVFYCNPSSPYQKGSCENLHEYIRRVCPKETSFDNLDQGFFNLLFSHINSVYRKKLNDHSPYDLFSSLFGTDINIQDIFHITRIDPHDVNLTPSLLRSYLSSLGKKKKEDH